VCLALIVAGGAQAVAGAEETSAPAIGPLPTAEMLEEAAAAQAAYEAAQARRQTAEARAERVRSRTAYRGLGRDAALALAMEKLGEVFEASAFERWQPSAGMHVTRYAGKWGAVLEGEGGEEPLFVEAMGTPLTSDLGSGAREPVDLALEPVGADAFAPRNPVVPTRIGRDGSASFAGSRTAIRVAGAAPEVPVETNGRLFYANALRDTDMAIAPIPGGVSFSFSVRSADAPEQAVLDFDLPADVRLRPAAGVPGLVELVRGAEVVGHVYPPTGRDADGEPVAVGYSIDGDRLRVNYPHREKDLAYPLYIDPDYDGWEGSDWGGWAFEEGGSTDFNGGIVGTAPPYLRVWNTANKNFNHLSFGAYRFANPRGYIKKLEGGWLSHDHAYTCVNFGILVPDRTAWKARYTPTCNTDTTNAMPVVSNTDTRYGDHAMLQYWMNQTAVRTFTGYTQMYSARATYSDNETPTVTSVGNSTGSAWKKAGASVTITPTGIDQGLGIWSFALYPPGVTPKSWFPGCDGTRQGGRCPITSVSAPMTYTIPADSPEGALTVTGWAQDLLGKRGNYSTTVKVDRTPPTLTLSGPLYEARGTTIRGADHVLHVEASDQPALSGLSHVEIKAGSTTTNVISGTDWRFSDSVHGPSGSSSATPVITPYTIQVTAIDQAGNRSPTQSFTVKWSSQPCDGTPLQ
jgi:hypothetical protein